MPNFSLLGGQEVAQIYLPGVGGSNSDYNASLSSNWTELDWIGTELDNSNLMTSQSIFECLY